MSVNKLILVNVLKGTMRVIEIEEVDMWVKLISLPDDSNKLVQINLPRLVDLYINWYTILLVIVKDSYSYIWYSLIVKHYIIIELLVTNHIYTLFFHKINL